MEDVRAFGDKLHLRVVSGQAESVIAALAEAFPTDAGERAQMHAWSPRHWKMCSSRFLDQLDHVARLHVPGNNANIGTW